MVKKKKNTTQTSDCCLTMMKYVYIFEKMNKPQNLSLLFQVLSYKSFFFDTPQSH